MRMGKFLSSEQLLVVEGDLARRRIIIGDRKSNFVPLNRLRQESIFEFDKAVKTFCLWEISMRLAAGRTFLRQIEETCGRNERENRDIYFPLVQGWDERAEKPVTGGTVSACVSYLY